MEIILLTFDGEDDYVGQYLLLLMINSLLVMKLVCRFKTYEFTGWLLHWNQNENGETDLQFPGLYINQVGQLVASARYGIWNYVTTDESVNDDNWHYAGITFSENGVLSLYLDGNFKGSINVDDYGDNYGLMLDYLAIWNNTLYQ